ncbi:hypothetical protein Tco_1581629 [Tanacetum coccineum]
MGLKHLQLMRSIELVPIDSGSFQGHNKNGCKNPTIVLPPKPPTKKGRHKKAQVGVSSLVEEDLVDARVDSAPIVDDDYVEAPFLHEQTSQFEVGGLLMVEVKGLRL